MTTIPGLESSWGSHRLLLQPLGWGFFVEGDLASFSKLCSFSELLLLVRRCLSLVFMGRCDCQQEVIQSKGACSNWRISQVAKQWWLNFHQTHILPWLTCHKHGTVLVGFGEKETPPVPAWSHNGFFPWPCRSCSLSKSVCCFIKLFCQTSVCSCSCSLRETM